MLADLTLTTAMLMTSAPTAAPGRLQRMCFTFTGESETPLPETFYPLWHAMGTTGLLGDRSVTSSLSSIVAWRRVAEILPANDESEVFVAQLLASNRPRRT